MQVACKTLTTSENKILFVYSLMQEGEEYHFIWYYEEQECVPMNTWSWTDFESKMEKRFLPANIAKVMYKELRMLCQDKMDANSFLVKLTNLIYHA